MALSSLGLYDWKSAMAETLQHEPAPPTESQLHHAQSNNHERHIA
jgi:hypothetical protein